MNDEKYLTVSEMGVEPNESDKMYRVKEVPAEKSRQEKIDGNVDFILTVTGADVGATDIIRNVFYMDKAVTAFDMYDGWKSMALYMAGKLNVLEKEKERF